MLLSMTGFGEARVEGQGTGPSSAVVVEIRATNNRYLKLATKTPEGHFALEHEIEQVVREFAARGSISVAAKIERPETESRYELDPVAINAYWDQLKEITGGNGNIGPSDLTGLSQLPGAIREVEQHNDTGERELILAGVRHAMGKLQEFRQTEGQKMADDLRKQRAAIAENLEEIKARAPLVVDEHRARLHERIGDLLAESDVELAEADLMREVAVFADRCDINEEITRLACHLDQFGTVLDGEVSMGRKLEFLGQEMFREINTIGAKANDIAIARSVVEMKGCIEKIREILQNVE